MTEQIDHHGAGTPGAAPTPVRNVSDTARWIATCRARESARKDAHFRDPQPAAFVEVRTELH
ncbi:MAG: hypothetical protein DMF89_01650 [Acidobacteria bacterium]|nr:MAG: hypothetical protein DMF90_16840 [Acidobacteriota bacterium]PYR52751.1 MAG: hypothetical protein DMF89_01650 [Acidobacteriota bacterium]